jgi:hypothetical protein
MVLPIRMILAQSYQKTKKDRIRPKRYKSDRIRNTAKLA